jgi:hypothetical protein
VSSVRIESMHVAYNFRSPTSTTFNLPGHIEGESIALGKYMIERQAQWPFTTRGKQGESWKPPEDWECTPDKGQSPASAICNFQTQQNCSVVEVTHLQKSILRMEAAGPKIVLERLKEEWTQVADASVYGELKLEKQLWMLTALRNLRKTRSTNFISPNHDVTKILSLYENQGIST